MDVEGVHEDRDHHVRPIAQIVSESSDPPKDPFGHVEVLTRRQVHEVDDHPVRGRQDMGAVRRGPVGIAVEVPEEQTEQGDTCHTGNNEGLEHDRSGSQE